MAGMCCGIVGGDADPTSAESAATIGVRRRRMEVLQQLKLITAATDIGTPEIEPAKRRKVEFCSPAASVGCDGSREPEKVAPTLTSVNGSVLEALPEGARETVPECAKFGATLIRGRRREMEDTVSIRPSFCAGDGANSSVLDFHFFGVFDGHGCSHVAIKCKARMHSIIKEEIEKEMGQSIEWKGVMERSFARMDMEVAEKSSNGLDRSCHRCLLRSDPRCDAGSTAVVAVVTPDKIVVANCGDSRAILCRSGVAVPLSFDHKPDRPDELERIESAGGRVIYWDGPRVMGFLAMSRAIGDDYLKPYVISEPEVTVTERTGEEECLIIGSDGLWDVVPNQTAAGVARMCLSNSEKLLDLPSPSREASAAGGLNEAQSSDKACLDASVLLTRLAMARHSADNVSVVVADLRSEF